MSQETSAFFARDYNHARSMFREAAAAAGLEIKTYENPAKGPDGGSLSVDVARAGPADAARVVVANSATHGAEGFCGSGIQVGWLRHRRDRDLPDDVAVLLIHGFNAYGFAWLRRVNEDNIDLNRNFIDHAAPYPPNDEYAELADVLLPADWEGPAREAAEQRIADYAAANGEQSLLRAARGQYAFPDGLFFGGNGPTWSHRALATIAAEQLALATDIAFIDLHTGLGPYGVGEALCYHPPGTDAHDRVVAWYSQPVTVPYTGDAVSTVIDGKVGYGLQRFLPDALVAAVTLEFGTYPLQVSMDAIRADGWLHLHGDPASPLGRRIKQQMRDAFYPDKDDWKAMIWSRGDQIMAQAIAGLAALG